MIVELRTYTFQPGKVPEFLALYEAEAMAIQKRILGAMLGYYTAESGVLNQVLHMWAYSSVDDRHNRRQALAAEPAWQGYLAKVLPLIVTMESKILVPTSFSPPIACGSHTPSRPA